MGIEALRVPRPACSSPPSASVPPSKREHRRAGEAAVLGARGRPSGPGRRARGAEHEADHLAPADRDAEPAARRDRQHREAAGDHSLDQRQRRHRERRHVQAPGEKARPNPIAHQRERNSADALRRGFRIATSGALTAPRCLHSSATPEIRAQPKREYQSDFAHQLTGRRDRVAPLAEAPVKADSPPAENPPAPRVRTGPSALGRGSPAFRRPLGQVRAKPLDGLASGARPASSARSGRSPRRSARTSSPARPRPPPPRAPAPRTTAEVWPSGTGAQM